jgi:hypothetical protein
MIMPSLDSTDSSASAATGFSIFANGVPSFAAWPARDLADAQDYPFEDRSDLLHRSPIANFEDQACVWRA